MHEHKYNQLQGSEQLEFWPTCGHSVWRKTCTGDGPEESAGDEDSVGEEERNSWAIHLEKMKLNKDNIEVKSSSHWGYYLWSTVQEARGLHCSEENRFGKSFRGALAEVPEKLQ